MIIQKDFWIVLIRHAQFFNQSVLILQNVLIPRNSILTTHSLTKCFNTTIVYTTDTHFFNSSMNIGYISFFAISDTQKSHDLLGTNINSSLIFFIYFYFFKLFTFFKFNMASQKSDKNNSIKIIFLIISITKINIIKIYIKNTHSIPIKYSIIRIFSKIEYIFVCRPSSKMFFNHFTRKKQIGNKFNAARQSSTALSHIFWVFYWSGTYLIEKGSSQIILLQMSVTQLVLYSFILIWDTMKYIETFSNGFITHFFGHKAFRNKFYWRRICIDSSITLFRVL